MAKHTMQGVVADPIERDVARCKYRHVSHMFGKRAARSGQRETNRHGGIPGTDARLFDDRLEFSGQRADEASAILQLGVVSNGFNRLTSKSAKSVMLRVTTVSLWTMAVAAIIASS